MEYFWGLGGKVSMQPAIRIQKTSYLSVPRISAQNKHFMPWSRELSISKGDHLSYYLRILETGSASLQLLDSNVPEGDYGES